jgi:NitT/TauT family transport system substrate-binding protein
MEGRNLNRHQFSRKGFVAGGMALAAGVATAKRAAAQTLETVNIAVVPIVVCALPYYAADLGIFHDAGIDPKITAMKNGDAIIAGVLSGSIDFGFSNAFSLAVAHEKGIPVKILFGTEIAGQNPTNGILTVLKNSPVVHPKDLNGMTIAVSSLGSTNMFAVENWIDKGGGDAKTVKYVEVPAPLMADTLLSRRVDAASMDAVNLAYRKDQLRELAPTYSSIAPRFIGGGYVATAAWIDAHHDLTMRIIGCLRKTAIYANSHKAETQKLYASHSRFTLADVLSAPFPTYSTEPSPEMIQPLIDLASRYGAIKQSFPARDLISTVAAT